MRRFTSTSFSPAEGGELQDADTGGTAPATGVGLGNVVPPDVDEVGEEEAPGVT
ncbi:MAG TPA: hypothetical protein VFL29_14155 [Candidatus Dormibacteraeota bacterium]|nr:hypothetical protein [Candidatus Dormibacteraeota bacterium]